MQLVADVWTGNGGNGGGGRLMRRRKRMRSGSTGVGEREQGNVDQAQGAELVASSDGGVLSLVPRYYRVVVASA
jgi:hypothetical protein